jgi:hypothetical protein
MRRFVNNYFNAITALALNLSKLHQLCLATKILIVRAFNKQKMAGIIHSGLWFQRLLAMKENTSEILN